jgi:hypothetical protein
MIMGDGATALILHYPRSLVLSDNRPADKSRASSQSPLQWTGIQISVNRLTQIGNYRETIIH